MATYLFVPLKRTWDVDLETPLKGFISDTFKNTNPEDYTNALSVFNKLRTTMVNKSSDKHESALEVLYRYYDQLRAIEAKFPIAENQIRINFKWEDAFEKESLFSGKRTLTISSGGYEQMCVLFNIAALQSQIADYHNHKTDDGLKQAAKLLQQSSGIFTYLKENVTSYIQTEPTPDLQADTLQTLASLMLAQAQDCFCRKSINDKMKPTIVAKLCHQCSDFYADAMKMMQLESLRSLWNKDWLPNVISKQAAFHALAQYYQSLVSKEAKEFGEEIVRLRHARELMQAAETRGGNQFVFAELAKRIERELTSAEKDNDFIYHARLPERSSLAAVSKAPLAKSLPMTPPLSTNFKDLFDKVVPLVVYQALGSFDSRKAEIVNAEIGHMRESTDLLNSILTSLNLPAAIEDLSGSYIPQSILDKAVEVRSLGGIEYLSRLMAELPALLKRNKEILEEAQKQLQEEQQSDDKLREKFGERWTRTASSSLTPPMKSDADKYANILKNAVDADTVVKEKFASHRNGCETLSKSDMDIQQSLPAASPVASLQGSPVVAELRLLLEQVTNLKSSRESIEREIKETNCDMTSQFLTALAQDGVLIEESLSTKELDRVYGPLRRQVSDSISVQETLMADIQRVNNEFCQAKAQNKSAMSRESALKDLAAAYDNFINLKVILEEGTKFYNELTVMLVNFQSRVNNFCFARKIEKEELMKDLQTSIVKQPTAAPPMPSYQQPTVAPSIDGPPKPTPPARPPPPTRPIPSSAVPSPFTTQAPPVRPVSIPPPVYGSATPYPMTSSMPYPSYPMGGYAPPPMPQGYNPYSNYQPYPVQPDNRTPYPMPQPTRYPPTQQWR